MTKCTQCGADLADNALFCPACGCSVSQQQGSQMQWGQQDKNQPAYNQPQQNYNQPSQQEQMQQPYSQQYNQMQQPYAQPYPQYQQEEKKSSKGAVIGICVGVIAVIAILIFALCKLGGKGYEKPIRNLMDGMIESDSEKMLSAFPDNFVDEMVDESGLGKKQFYKTLDTYLSYSMEDYDKATYKITDAERLDKDDVKDYEDDYQEYFEDSKVTDGYLVEVTAKYDGEKESEEFEVYKVDGKWTISINLFDDLGF